MTLRITTDDLAKNPALAAAVKKAKGEQPDELVEDEAEDVIDKADRLVDDIRLVQFNKQMIGGYSIHEVDNFLDHIAKVVQKLRRDNRRLRKGK